MAEEYIIYKIEQSPIKFKDKIKLTGYHNDINLIIFPTKTGFDIKIIFLGGNNIRDKINFARENINRILDILTFKYVKSFSEPKEYEKNIYNSQTIYSETKTFKTKAKKIIEKDEVNIILNNYNDNKGLYLNLFRKSLNERNNVSSFMFLYNIMLSLFEDNQTKIDCYIKKKFKSVDFSDSPYENKKESVFTRLRNEVAHNRKSSTFKSTKKEIFEHLNKFKNIVKETINDVI